jgi:hypothetical protein
MPNAAPPLPPVARRRAAELISASAARPAVPRGAAAAPARAAEGSPTPSGGPAAWAGFGALLAGAGERTPAGALRLAAASDGGTTTAAAVDLSGMWALPPPRPRPAAVPRAVPSACADCHFRAPELTVGAHGRSAAFSR